MANDGTDAFLALDAFFRRIIDAFRLAGEKTRQIGGDLSGNLDSAVLGLGSSPDLPSSLADGLSGLGAALAPALRALGQNLAETAQSLSGSPYLRGFAEMLLNGGAPTLAEDGAAAARTDALAAPSSGAPELADLTVDPEVLDILTESAKAGDAASASLLALLLSASRAQAGTDASPTLVTGGIPAGIAGGDTVDAATAASGPVTSFFPPPSGVFSERGHSGIPDGPAGLAALAQSLFGPDGPLQSLAQNVWEIFAPKGLSEGQFADLTAPAPEAPLYIPPPPAGQTSEAAGSVTGDLVVGELIIEEAAKGIQDAGRSLQDESASMVMSVQTGFQI